jgi:hypothetical protein
MDWFPIRWLVGALLAAAALGGLFLASAAGGGAGYAAGLALFLMGVLGVFAVIGDGWRTPGATSDARWADPLPSNGALRWMAAGVIAAVGLMGLFHASAAAGSASYSLGVALFLITLAYDFLLLKDWFDRRDA